MKVLVTFAIEAEFAAWRSCHPFVRYEVDELGRPAEFDLFRTNDGVNEVTVLLTGMGKKSALDSLRTIRFERHDVCISTGLAGALDTILYPGDIVVARGVMHINTKLGCPSDGDLVDFAVACGARVVDLFVTAENIVATAGQKHALNASGNVVEMESAHILAAAKDRQVPAVAVRAISDTADEDLPLDFQSVTDSHGQVKFGRLLTQLARHPQRIPSLVRFGRQSRSAGESLADFLDRYIPVMANRWSRVCKANGDEVAAT